MILHVIKGGILGFRIWKLVNKDGFYYKTVCFVHLIYGKYIQILKFVMFFTEWYMVDKYVISYIFLDRPIVEITTLRVTPFKGRTFI